MKSKIIEGHARIVGKSQGYIPLALRDEKRPDGIPQMVTSWELFPDELERIKAGAPVVLTILGEVHPPVLLTVGKVPE